MTDSSNATPGNRGNITMSAKPGEAQLESWTLCMRRQVTVGRDPWAEQ